MAKRRPLFDRLEQRLCMAAPTLQTTFSLPSGSWTPTVYRASPLFADIFNTGSDDLITVASGAQLVAYAENANGSATLVVTYKVPSGVADIKATPVIVTDPRTGRKDLFAAMGQDENNLGTLEDNRVFGWDLQTGNLLPGWTLGQSDGFNAQGYTGAYGALTSGNLTSDGIPDIVVTSFSHEVSAFTIDGNLLWQWDNDDTIASGAVIADIDRDGLPEVVVGGDSSTNTVFPQFQQGGWVNVISNTGQLKWRRAIPGEVTWSSPVVADLNNNGYLDIVIGTGDNYSYTQGVASTEAGDYIYAFDPFGNMLPGWPYHTTFTGDTQGHEVLAAPAVDDLLGNGQLDIVALDRAGYIHVIQPNGQDLPGFAGGKRLDPDLSQSQLPDNYGSPIIADVNGDGKPDIVAGSGPYLRAFDTSGNLIDIGTTPTGTGGLPEGMDIAPAVGNFDGSGGLTLAIVTYDAENQNRPDMVQIYRLPQSTLAPPWPFLRRTITGDAVERSNAYDQQYVAMAFNTLMGSQPASATLQLYVNALNSDSTNLLSTAQYIASSPSVRQSEVSRIYQAYLGHSAGAYALNYWSTYLGSNTYRQMESVVASSPEFAQRAGGSFSQEITQLYQAALNRAPAQSEINGWAASNLSIGSIAAAILNSSESITDQFNTTIQAMFGQGSQSYIPPDDKVAYSYNIHTGVSEEQIISETLASQANLASTNFVAGYIENLYRDILGRMGSPSDVAYWLTQVDTGVVAFGNLASLFVNSTEAREDFVQSEFLTLLGRAADSGTLASLANYSSRESLVILIVGSPEYFTKNGGTNASFVVAAFRDLAAIGISQDTINSFVTQMNAGLTTTEVAGRLIYGGSLYFTNLVVNQLMIYIPNEAQGVLRTGLAPANAAGQPINPDPNLINYFLGLYGKGYSDEQVLSIIFTSPQYDSSVSYNRGILRALGVRY